MKPTTLCVKRHEYPGEGIYYTGMRFGLFAAALLLSSFVLSSTVDAQSLPGLGGIGGDTFSLSASPQYPLPYSQITVSPASNSLDLTNATLTVLVNGKETYKGSVHTFPVQLGGAGTVTTIHATVFSGGTNYSKTISIQPQDVTLVAEPISSAPPLYPGEPSVPIQGNVRLVAVADLKAANGAVTNPATDAYAWTVNGIHMPDSSGIGKSSIIVPSPLQYREGNVSVVVTDSSGSLVGGASISLTASEPLVRVYQNDPLLGIRYSHALSGSYTISGAESTLYAAPFSLPITNSAPLVQWFLNGSSVQTGDSITLRPAGSGQGSASLSLTATAGNSTMATANLSLLFGLPVSSNPFGL